MKFKKGDRVISYAEPVLNEHYNIKDKMGTVIADGDIITVEFDECINRHNGNECGIDDSCLCFSNHINNLALLDNKFKNGDRIKVTRDYNGNTDIVGKTGKVNYTTFDSVFIKFDEIISYCGQSKKSARGYYWWIPNCTDYLEFEKTEFKTGDRVRCVAECNTRMGCVGKIGTVIDVSSCGTVLVKFYKNIGGHNGNRKDKK